MEKGRERERERESRRRGDTQFPGIAPKMARSEAMKKLPLRKKRKKSQQKKAEEEKISVTRKSGLGSSKDNWHC